MHILPGVTDSFMEMTQLAGIMVKGKNEHLNEIFYKLNPVSIFTKLHFAVMGKQIQIFEKINNKE